MRCTGRTITHNIREGAILKLKDEYGIWICPNGGELKEKIFRVGHIGALTVADNDDRGVARPATADFDIIRAVSGYGKA